MEGSYGISPDAIAVERVTSIFRGTLGILSLFDVVHFLVSNRLTGVLRIDDGTVTGYLEMKGGRLLTVSEWLGEHSDEVALEFFGWEAGEFEFRAVAVDSKDAIKRSTESYLLDLARRVDDWRRDNAKPLEDEPEEARERSERITLLQKRRTGTPITCEVDPVCSVASCGVDAGSEFDVLLRAVTEKCGTMLYIKANVPPRFVGDGESRFLRHEPVSEETFERCWRTVFEASGVKDMSDDLRFELMHEVEGAGSFIVRASREFGARTLSAQLVKTEVPTFGELNLPIEHMEACATCGGLVLVAGGRRSGKSTTAASILHYINMTQAKVVHTFEQTMEYKHRDVLSVVNQTRVSFSDPDFLSTVEFRLSENPDVIYVEELCGGQVAAIVLDAARKGCTVLATINASDCVDALLKFSDLFPDDEKKMVLKTLSWTCGAVIAQELVESRGGGFVPVIEFMPVIKEVSALICGGYFSKLQGFMQRPPFAELISFEGSRELLRGKGLLE